METIQLNASQFANMFQCLANVGFIGPSFSAAAIPLIQSGTAKLSDLSEGLNAAISGYPLFTEYGGVNALTCCTL